MSIEQTLLEARVQTQERNQRLIEALIALPDFLLGIWLFMKPDVFSYVPNQLPIVFEIPEWVAGSIFFSLGLSRMFLSFKGKGRRLRSLLTAFSMAYWAVFCYAVFMQPRPYLSFPIFLALIIQNFIVYIVRPQR